MEGTASEPRTFDHLREHSIGQGLDERLHGPVDAGPVFLRALDHGVKARPRLVDFGH